MPSPSAPAPTFAITAYDDASRAGAQAPTGYLSTPETARKSGTLGATERALASSPILGGAELSPLRAISERSSANNSYRNSIASSFRLSRDLDDLRWDGSPLKEDDSIFNGDDASRRGYQAGSESEGDTSQRNGVAQVTYSTLSKRADLILANAKRKLNLLEGNLGRARHSLVIAPHTLSELNRSDSTASTQSAPFPQNGEEQRIAGKGPKISFGAPRSGIAPGSSRNGRTLPGHSRVFSDTSIPSKSGVMPAGSRSLDFPRNREFGTRYTLHRLSPDLVDKGLGSVPEDKATEDAARTKASEDESDSRRSSSSSNKDLQSQANQLRNRISYLQSRSRDGSLRRRSLNGDLGIVSANSEEHEGNRDLKADAVAGSEPFRADTDHDPRAEWQRVLEKRANESDDSASYMGEHDYYDDDDDKLPDALADELLDDMDPDALDRPHETRNDAFDYEHFILHSIMGGSGGGVRPGSLNSSASASTERAWEDEAIAAEESGWIDSSQLYQPYVGPVDDADQSESDTDSEQDDVHAGLNEAWPVPPSARNSKAALPPGHGREASRGSLKPVDSSTSEVLAAEDNLNAEDKALFYAVAESFREVCMRLQRGNLGPHDGVDLRQRLEIARRVLKGEL